MVQELTILAEAPKPSGRGGGHGGKTWETGSSQEVKELTEEDLNKYTIFDVVMPLPGFDVEYPGGRIGEMYAEIIKADGMDIHRMKRDQRCVPSSPFYTQG
jgi:tRNA pseudouridine13 synthase